MNDYLEATPLQQPRSGLLTVLCILTFLGSAYGIASSMMQYSMSDQMTVRAKEDFEKEKANAQKEIAGKEDKGSKIASRLLQDADSFMDSGKLKQSAIGGLMANAITFLAAFLMFRQKRVGFWIYVAGTVVGIALPFVVFGQNMLAGLSALLPGFFGVIFIALYAFTLKEMD